MSFTPEAIQRLQQLPTLTVVQAMAVMQVSRRTIDNWMAKGKVEVKRTAGNCPRIVTSSLWRRNEDE